MPVTSISPLPKEVFHPMKVTLCHLEHLQNAICKCFEFGLVHNFVINPLQDDKILDQTKFKAFPDDKCNKNDNFCL